MLKSGLLRHPPREPAVPCRSLFLAGFSVKGNAPPQNCIRTQMAVPSPFVIVQALKTAARITAYWWHCFGFPAAGLHFSEPSVCLACRKMAEDITAMAPRQ